MAGSTKLLDPDLRRMRALMIIERRVKQAMSIPAIAEEFHVSEKTIAKEIDWAKRAGLVAGYEDQILEGLVPGAIKTFKDALEKGDTQVALEVLKGTGLLRKPTDKPIAAPAAEEDSLEIHIKRIRGTNQQTLPAAAATGIDLGSVLEGSILGAATATPSLGAGGDENHDAHDESDLGISADAQGLPLEPALAEPSDAA